MFAEVLNPTKPPAPHRATIAGVLLMLIASALAGEMTWCRSSTPPVSRLHPPTWKISFQPPRGWIRDVKGQDGANAVIIFRGTNRARQSTTLVFWRLEQETGGDLDTICALILGVHGAQVSPNHRPTDLRDPTTKFGAVDGYELADPQQRTVVRAAQVSADEAYAVSLSVDTDVIDEHVYRLYDLACRSIEYEDR